MGVGSYIGQVNIGQDSHAIGSTLYGTCDTPATTAAKVATLVGFGSLPTGVTVHIKFTTANTVASGVTLKVGTTDAKPVTNPNGSLLWVADSIISFTYDGISWVMNSFQIDASNITIDVSQLSNLSLGNITNEGKITGHASSLVVTDSNAAIIGGAAFGNTADGTFLDNTGTWSTPDKGVTSITISTTSPLEGGSSTATTATGTYTLGLASGYGDTQNPYAAKAPHYVLAGPNSGSANGVPSFRELVAADLPAGSTTATGIVQLSAAADDATKAATAKSVYDLSTTVNSLLASADALVYKGTLTGAATATNGGAYTPAASKGDVYKVLSAGYINGVYAEAGDMFICNTDSTAAATSSTYTAVQEKWDVVQANLTNAVISNGGTSGYLAKFSGPNTVVNGPQIVENGTGFLRQDGTWATPDGTYSLPLAANGTRGGIQIGYAETNGVKNYAVKLSSEKAYVTVPWEENTHYTTKLIAGGSSATSNATVSSGNVYLRLFDVEGTTNNHRNNIQLHAGTNMEITSNDSGVITFKNTYSYTLPHATSDALGGIKIGYTGDYYAVQLDANDKAYVNVPWTDTKVTQSPYSTATNYEFDILFKKTNNHTEETSGVNYSTVTNKTLTFNPSTGTLSAAYFKGALDDSVLGIDSTVTSVLTFYHKSGAWKTLSINNTTTTVASVSGGILTLVETVDENATLAMS